MHADWPGGAVGAGPFRIQIIHRYLRDSRTGRLHRRSLFRQSRKIVRYESSFFGRGFQGPPPGQTGGGSIPRHAPVPADPLEPSACSARAIASIRLHGFPGNRGATQALARLPGSDPIGAAGPCGICSKKREAALTPLLAGARRVRRRSRSARPAAMSNTSIPARLRRPAPRQPRCSASSRKSRPLGPRPIAAVPGRFHGSADAFGARRGAARDLGMRQLVSRVPPPGIDEVVLAMNATLEGQPRPLHRRAARDLSVRLPSSPTGLPVGGELD